MSSESAIVVTELGKAYRVSAAPRPANLSELVESLRDRRGRANRAAHWKWALRGVSFEVARGEVLGVIGPNGAGKSTLLSILARITEPTEGQAVIHGRVNGLLEVGTGFHPELSGRDNVYLNGAILGMTRREIAAKFEDIVNFAEVREYIDVPVKRYSSGMRVRLAFAVAAHLEPDVLLLDEVLSVGDVAFQEKCHVRIEEMTRAGRTVLFVSHDPNSVRRLCNRAVLIDRGRVAHEGDVEETIAEYIRQGHPLPVDAA